MDAEEFDCLSVHDQLFKQALCVGFVNERKPMPEHQAFWHPSLQLNNTCVRTCVQYLNIWGKAGVLLISQANVKIALACTRVCVSVCVRVCVCACVCVCVCVCVCALYLNIRPKAGALTSVVHIWR